MTEDVLENAVSMREQENQVCNDLFWLINCQRTIEKWFDYVKTI